MNPNPYRNMGMPLGDDETIIQLRSVLSEQSESQLALILEQQAVIEQMRVDTTKAIADLHEHCDNHGPEHSWEIGVCRIATIADTLEEALALTPSLEALEARDRKRDASILRSVALDLFYHRDRTELLARAAAREAGTWNPKP